MKYVNPSSFVYAYQGKAWGHIVALKEKIGMFPYIVYKSKNFNDTIWSDEKQFLTVDIAAIQNSLNRF